MQEKIVRNNNNKVNKNIKGDEMKKLTLLIMVILPSLAFANTQKSLKCRVDEPIMGGEKLHVPVTIVEGARIVTPIVTDFKGHQFSAVWLQGDSFEPQAALSMNFGDINSIMYDFELEGHSGPINVITYAGLRFQCWVESSSRNL